MKKQLNWEKIQSIEFHARKVLMNNPSLAKSNLAKALLFLCHQLRTLRAQNESLQDRVNKLEEKNETTH